jgi:hypothetical protein
LRVGATDSCLDYKLQANIEAGCTLPELGLRPGWCSPILLVSGVALRTHAPRWFLAWVREMSSLDDPSSVGTRGLWLWRTCAPNGKTWYDELKTVS